ncbi:MAG: hypothetical protein IJY18_00840 [Clostridia bacterium]|nr:hypothetical protein [Clostridia bacterium]
MKQLIAASIALAFVVAAVFLNSYFVEKCISDIIDEVEDMPNDGELSEYEALYERYMKRQGFIALTVSHEDLTVIEDIFAELLGSVKAKDEDGITIAKSRLSGALWHLRRLSGVNFDSIF